MGIGQSPRRKEDERLITGRGRFIDDIAPPGLVHLAVVRSTHARARIVAIDTAAGARCQVSASSSPTICPVWPSPYPPRARIGPTPMSAWTRRARSRPSRAARCATSAAAFAAVIGPDPYVAADAAELVRVEYDAWPAVVDAEAAMTAASPVVHEGASNVVGHVVKVIGDVDRAFAAADVVVEDHPSHGRVTSMAIETRGLSAAFDPVTGSMTVWAAHQAPYHLRSVVAARLVLPAESARVIAPDPAVGSARRKGSIRRTCSSRCSRIISAGPSNGSRRAPSFCRALTRRGSKRIMRGSRRRTRGACSASTSAS